MSEVAKIVQLDHQQREIPTTRSSVTGFLNRPLPDHRFTIVIVFTLSWVTPTPWVQSTGSVEQSIPARCGALRPDGASTLESSTLRLFVKIDAPEQRA